MSDDTSTDLVILDGDDPDDQPSTEVEVTSAAEVELVDDEDSDDEFNGEDSDNGLVPVYEDYTLVEQVPKAELDDRIAQAQAELEQAVEAAMEVTKRPEEQTDPSTGTALVLAGQSPDIVKRNMGEIRVKAMKAEQLVQGKKRELKRLMKAKADELERVMTRTLGPLQKMMAQLQEGIWTINLYLGRDEFLVQIMDGDPAPADTPVTVRQLVLAMDQEMAVAAESGGIDSTALNGTNDDANTIFDKWLRADPAHLQQVLPEPKGIVALQPRFNNKHYEDPWKAAAVAKMNRETYFLIRNGDKVYRVSCEFEAGRFLIPRENDLLPMTKDRWGKPIEPGTSAWLEAEEKADARQRHFMRIALVLQGLVDRTAVFHPLPSTGLSFLNEQHYHEGKVKVITDAEKQLTQGRESFRDWQKRLNSQLRPGLRIIGAFGSEAFRYSNRFTKRDVPDHWKHSRIWPHQAEKPKSLDIHTLAKGNGNELVIRYARTEEVYDRNLWIPDPDRPGWGYRGGYKTPKTKASCVIKPGDRFVIAYDLATVEEMEFFLQARGDRHDYEDMFPVLKAAVAAKKAEREEEEPFRTMLVGTLTTENGVSVEDAEEVIDDLILWYKLGNKHHRALAEDDRKATLAIIKEHAARLKAADADERVVAAILDEYPKALIVGRRKDGKYMAYVPATKGDVFVHQLAFTATGKPSREWDGETRRDWILPSPRSFNSWQLVYTAKRWRDWDLTATLKKNFTGPEIKDAVERVRAMMTEAGERPVALTYSENSAYTHNRIVGYVKDKPKKYKLSVRVRPQGPSFHKRDHYMERLKDGSVKIVPSTHLESAQAYRDDLPWNNARWEDSRILIAVTNEKREYEKWLAAYRALEDVVEYGDDSIERQWLADEWQRRFERFIDEVPDASLWEDHKKTIRDVDYPYHRRVNKGGQVEALLEHAVDEDIAIDGLAVRDIARALGATEDEKGRYVFKGEWPDARWSSDREKTIRVPADVLDYVVSTEKYVEPTEDEDSDE